MELNGTHKFTAPPQSVWNALHNDAIVNSCLPGGNSVAWQGDSAVRLTIAIGPVKGSPTVQVEEQTPPSHLKFGLSRGGATGALSVDLAPEGAGTVLTYAGAVDAGGPLGMALGMAHGMVKSQLDQFFTKLESQVK